jgi:hypothetical protein
MALSKFGTNLGIKVMEMKRQAIWFISTVGTNNDIKRA